MPFVLQLLGGYFVVAGLLIYIMIMGPSRYHRDGYVGAAHRKLQAAPGALGYLLCLVGAFGNKATATRRWAAAEARVMRKRHPTLQIFYLALMACCYYVFFTYVYPRIDPRDGVSRPLSIAASIAAIAIYFAACWVDPGIVKDREKRAKLSDPLRRREDRLDARYKGDGILFPEDDKQADCRTCAVPKPARSKHCRVCGHCVRRFDHHCAWLNGDVGEGNILWFHLFLVWHVLISLLYAGLCFLVILDWIEQEGLWRARFVAKGGRTVLPSYTVIGMYALSSHPAIVALGVFAVLIAAMLFAFWVSHLRNAMRNQTSNEAFKAEEYESILWHELAQQRREQKLKRQEGEAGDAGADDDNGDAKKPKKPRRQGSSEPDEKVAAADGARREKPLTPALIREEVTKAKKAYDRGGRLANIMDTFGWANPPPRVPPTRRPKKE